MTTAAPETPVSSLYATVDDDQTEVYELVRSDDTGMYIRDNRSWVRINPDDDNDRIWDVTIIELTDAAVDAFDNAQDDGDPVPIDVIMPFDIDKDSQA